MSKLKTSVEFLAPFALGFLCGLLALWLYINRMPESAATTPAKTRSVERIYYNNEAADMERDVARRCSVMPNTCEVLFNNKKTSTIQLVGDVNKTWVILGDKKIESSVFYRDVYLGNYPEGVSGISFR